MDLSNVDVKRLDHLGIVKVFCENVQIKEIVDKYLPKNSHRSKISNGTLLVAMILNGLGFVGRTLHMYPEYFYDKPTELLLGEGILAEHINDDALGRCLDDLYDFGISELYEELALSVISHLGLECKSINLDSTSFHLDGNYDRESDSCAIEIKHGYSRDHRPDLKQVVLQLITENQAGIPLYMKACSGNKVDTSLFKATVKSHVKSLKAAYKNKYFIADAALYTEETIKELSNQNQLFITRVPQKLKAARNIISQSNEAAWVDLKDGYKGAWFEEEYGDVKQKWLLVKSSQAEKRETHILAAAVEKSIKRSEVEFKKLSRIKYSCANDANEALEKWVKHQKFVEISEINIVQNITKRSKKGRPSLDAVVNYEFNVSAKVLKNEKAILEASKSKGLFIIGTNDLAEDLSMQFVLDEYKSQQAVERGFRFLKSPDFLTSSLFLKKPERIEALLMVMTCSLMVYAAIEHFIRKSLVMSGTYFPDMKKKPTQKPTAKWVFFCFTGISIIHLDNHQAVTNIINRHEIILNCLGHRYKEIYS